MKLSVVIVNWNTRDLLEQCLTGVQRFLDGIEKEVLVIDNDSTDTSAVMVRDAFPGVRLEVNDCNIGPVAANNQGIAATSGEYVLLLNTDALLLDSSLKDMITYLDVTPDAAAVAPQLLNDDGSLQASFFTFPSVGRYIQDIFSFLARPWAGYHEPRVRELKDPGSVDWVPAACLLLRRSALPGPRPFDEGYFYLCDDADLCLRLNRVGKQIHFYPQAQVVHLGGASTDGDDDDHKLRDLKTLAIKLHSWHYYFRKNHGTGVWMLIKGAELCAGLLRIVTSVLRMISLDDIPHKGRLARYELERIKLNLTRL